MRSKRQEFTDICGEQDRLLNEMRAISKKASDEGRDLRPDESAKYEKKQDELNAVGERKNALYAELFDGSRMTRDVMFATPASTTDGRSAALAPEHRFVDWQVERGVPGLTRDELREVSLDRVIGAWVTGRRDELNETEHRVLAEGVDATGGFTVPEILGGSLIDLARNAARVIAAGASTVPVTSDQQSIARLSEGVVGTWRAENAAVTEDDPAFERVTFRPKSNAVLTRLSRELAEDMIPSSFNGVTNELGQAIGLAVDFAALRGDTATNANQPNGVRFQSGVEIQSLGANGLIPLDYDHLIDAVAGVQADNFEPNAFIYSSRTAKTYGKFADTTGQPLARPPFIADMRHLISNQVPNDLDQGTSTDVASEVYTGKWAELLIGVRSNLRLEILRERYADSLQVGLIAHVRMDVQLAHPKAFVVTTGVLA